jgi:hypothetical protein
MFLSTPGRFAHAVTFEICRQKNAQDPFPCMVIFGAATEQPGSERSAYVLMPSVGSCARYEYVRGLPSTQDILQMCAHCTHLRDHLL